MLVQICMMETDIMRPAWPKFGYTFRITDRHIRVDETQTEKNGEDDDIEPKLLLRDSRENSIFFSFYRKIEE